ncbi:MAG TPA: TIGR02391 family protein [Anaerolineae bacterium]|nr:TIGR02391 family protein [Anaerolineae bacterium]
MNTGLESLLHPRILSHCQELYTSGHYKHAALEAMTQVELALKEKSGVENRYGVNLVTSVFGTGKGIKLRVPFGEKMQKHAEALFRGAFSYYRNYAAHDGSEINEQTCARVMILASELLDLIGASAVSFADVGGLPGLIKAGIFPDEKSVLELLNILQGWVLPDDVADGLYEHLMTNGFTDTQVHAVIDVDLIEYISEDYYIPIELIHERDTLPSTLGRFELTELGKKVVASLEKKAG